MIYLQEYMEQKILKLSTLKRSTRFNMHRLREERNEVLNAAKYNSTTETIEELDKLRQIMEEKKMKLWKLMRSKTFLWNNVSS